MMISYDDSRFGNFYWGVPDFHDYMISYEAMMIYDDNLWEYPNDDHLWYLSFKTNLGFEPLPKASCSQVWFRPPRTGGSCGENVAEMMQPEVIFFHPPVN